MLRGGHGLHLLVVTVLTTHRRTYSTASERVTIPLGVRGLTHFDQMTVGIPDVAPDLVLMLLRRREELP